MTNTMRDRVTTASALASGTEGPVRVALDRLRQFGLGERVIKSSLAAGLAWFIASLIHDDPLPVLAPITAIFTIQLTLAKSVIGSVQRILGVGAGIAIGIGATRIIGLHWWVISLVVLVSLVAGLRIFKLEPSGVEQMTVSGLLVMIVGSNANVIGVAGYHALDTLIGTAVGLAANTLIAPPSHVPAARVAVRSVGARLIATIDELASSLASGIDSIEAQRILGVARSVAADLDEVQLALDRAEESLKFNLPGRRQQEQLHRYRRANRAVEHASVQVRVISRTVADCANASAIGGEIPVWLEPDALGTPLANLLSAIAVYLEHFLELADNPESVPHDLMLTAEVESRRQEVTLGAANRLEALMPDKWVLIGEILSISNQLVTDLSSAAEELSAKS